MELTTSTAKMRSEAEEIRQLAGQYKLLQKAVFDSGRALDGMWDGDANQSFMNRMKVDEPRFDELFTVINQYCASIDESATDYDSTESRVSEKMNSNPTRRSR